MRVLISGAGIAGPTLAFWLNHYGFTPTIIETAPKLRSGGYIIDFWGGGFDVAERIGLIPDIYDKGYVVRELRVVGPTGERIAGFPVDSFAHLTRGRYISLPRGELSVAIFNKIADKVETIFGDSVQSIYQSEKRVEVTLEQGGRREFDLVIGADGLHSRIRELVFGDESLFEKYLGYKVAAFEVEGYRPRDELIYVMYTEVGQQVARFALNSDRTMFLLTFADGSAAIPKDISTQKALLRKKFGSSGWECPRILDALDSSDNLYFDRVSQIRMEGQPNLWTRRRVTLVGDAACCVSLLGGQGSALAMVAAYILAGELHRANGDYIRAFGLYQKQFAPFVLHKQKVAMRFASLFGPKSRFSLLLRNQVFNLLRVDWIANRVFGRNFMDEIQLDGY